MNVARVSGPEIHPDDLFPIDVDDLERTSDLIAPFRPETHSIEDLYVIAQMATQYLHNGALRLAVILFEGLVAARPEEIYFRLALGLTYERLGHSARAGRMYLDARRLAPADPRPDINLGQLALIHGEDEVARRMLASAQRKAAAAGECTLAERLEARLDLLEAA